MVYCMKICEQGAKMFENTSTQRGLICGIPFIEFWNQISFPSPFPSLKTITVVVVHTNIMRLHTGFDLSVESVDLWIFPLVPPFK